jgi:hypothetical protein
MGGVFWRGGSWEIARSIAIAQLKMEDAYILCNIIEMFWSKKVIKTKKNKVFNPLEL